MSVVRQDSAVTKALLDAIRRGEPQAWLAVDAASRSFVLSIRGGEWAV
jgi:hypothetical protein